MKIINIKNPNRNQLFYVIKFDNGKDLEIQPDRIGTYTIGSDITQNEYNSLLKDSIQEKLIKSVYNYLSYKKRTESEVRKYIKDKIAKEFTIDKKIESSIEEKLIDRLKKLNYVDDNAYIESYLNYNNNKSNPYGINKIKVELLKKGINQELVNHIENTNEELNAQKVIEKKYKSKAKSIDTYMERGKILKYLTNRGYTYEIGKRTVDTLFPYN